MLEGRGARAALVAQLERRDPVLVSKNERVRLRVTGVYRGDLDLAQAWLEPVSDLTPGRSYLLELQGVPSAELRSKSLPIAFAIDRHPDLGAPIFMEPPSLIDTPEQTDLLATTIHDENAVLLRVDAVRTQTSDRRTIFHYPIDPRGNVSLAPQLCGSGLILKPFEPAVLTLSAIDAAGHLTSAPGRGLLRGAGGEREQALLNPYRSEDGYAPIELIVLVRDDAGLPLKNAKVTGLWRGHPTATTDKLGRAVFRGVTRRVVELRVFHAELGTLTQSMQLAEQTSFTATLRYGGGPRLLIRVEDRKHAPVWGAQVTIAGTSGEHLSRFLRTGVEGVASFGSLRAQTYEVFVDDRPTFAIAREQVDVASARTELTVVLQPAVTVKGRLLIGPGLEKSGWSVSATSVGVPSIIGLPSTSTTARAADDGRFELRGLSEGTYLISSWREKPTDPLLDGGKTRIKLEVRHGMGEIELRAGGAYLVEGTVSYEGGIKPNALCVALIGDGLTRVDARIDLLRSTFVALVPEVGDYRLIARAPGFVPAVQPIAITGDRPLRPKIALRKAEGARGTVVDPRGAPIAGALITARVPDFPGDPEQTSTDSEGRFELKELDPGPGVRVYIEARGRHPRAAELLESAPRIILPHGGPIAGRVLADHPREAIGRLIFRPVNENAPWDELELNRSGGFRTLDVPLGVFQAEVTSEATQRTWVRPFTRRELFTTMVLSIQPAEVELELRVPAEVLKTGALRLSLYGERANAAKIISAVPVPESGTVVVRDLWPGRYRAVLEWVGPSSIERIAQRIVTAPGIVELTP